MPPLAAACLLVGSALGPVTVAAQEAAPRFPITTEQRRQAEQVASAGVPLSELAPNAPDSYTIKRGDTLWGISGLFLRSPWRWPELWGMNKTQVRNPHLIYPGQQLVLIKGADGRARLQFADGSLPGGPGDLVKMSPLVRDLSAGDGGAAISSIPNNLIEPFLSQPRVVGADDLDRYGRIVATQEDRVNLGRGDRAYARGFADDRADNYYVFRPARPLYDPDDEKRATPIAYEAFYLGTARMSKRGEVATLQIEQSKQEIGVGDRLIPIERQTLVNYVPRSPEKAIEGRIVSVYGGVDQAGTQSVVTLNRGSADGVEIGNVLALLSSGPTMRDRTAVAREYVKIPDERIGEMFVFRVFDRVSYALILRVTHAVKVGDRFMQPDEVLNAPTAAQREAAAAGLPMAVKK